MPGPIDRPASIFGDRGSDKGSTCDLVTAPHAKTTTCRTSQHREPTHVGVGWYRIPDARDSGVMRPNLGRLSTFESRWVA